MWNNQIKFGILAPYFSRILHQDIGNGDFSLLIDESTDVSIAKLLGVAVRYFSANANDVVSTYLGLVELKKCDASGISAGVKTFCMKKH